MSLDFLLAPPTPPQDWPEDRRLVRRLERPEDSEPFGDPEPKHTPAERAEQRALVLRVMATRPGRWTLRDLAKATGLTTLHHLMRRLRVDGSVLSGGSGFWPATFADRVTPTLPKGTSVAKVCEAMAEMRLATLAEIAKRTGLNVEQVRGGVRQALEEGKLTPAGTVPGGRRRRIVYAMRGD